MYFYHIYWLIIPSSYISQFFLSAQCVRSFFCYLIILNTANKSRKSPMKGQNSNRIIPIRSLLENIKQEGKKPCPHLDLKNLTPKNTDHNITPRIREQSPFLVSHRHHPVNESFSALLSKEHKKGISVNKHGEKYGSEQRLPIQALPGDQPYTFTTSKKEIKNHAMTGEYPILSQEQYKSDFSMENYYNKSKKLQQTFSQQTRPELKQETIESKKMAEKNVFIYEGMEKESTSLTDKYNSKCQEETRNVSRCQKIENYPIFKDEITKIKTQLFHKEALLFQKTQQLEQKDKIIRFLQNKLEMSGNMNENVKKIAVKEKQLLEIGQNWRKKYEYQEKMSSICTEKLKIAEEKVRHQAECIEALRQKLSLQREQFKRYEADNSTNYALISLKIRQYEAEEKQKHHDLAQLKQKLNEQLENKESFIRELSAQVGDLKESLRNMEMRIREMIEQEEQLKKEIQEKQKKCRDLMLCKEDLTEQIKECESACVSISKGKQQFYESSISELKGKISQLNEIVFRRESSLIAYKEMNNDLEERLKKLSSANKITPQKVQPSKTAKNNEKLSAIIKDLNNKLTKSMRLNDCLNEEIAKRQWVLLNNTFSSKFKEQIQI